MQPKIISAWFFWMFDVVKMEGCFMYKASFYLSVVNHWSWLEVSISSILLKISIHQIVGGGSMLGFFPGSMHKETSLAILPLTCHNSYPPWNYNSHGKSTILMVFTIKDGGFSWVMLLSLLEILRPKKMDTPSLRVLWLLPFKASKKMVLTPNKIPRHEVHPWKIKCQKETSQHIHTICCKKATKNSRNFPTYLLENVAKELLVFPPFIKGIFFDTQGCS